MKALGPAEINIYVILGKAKRLKVYHYPYNVLSELFEAASDIPV